MTNAKKQHWFTILLFCVILILKAVKFYRAVQVRDTEEMYWNGFALLFAAGVIIYNIVQLRKLRGVDT